VPTPAVLSGAPGDYVYLANADHTVSVRKITPGPSDGKNTAILSGLAVGDTVVIDGTDRLTDGAKISIAEAGAASGAAPGAQPAATSKKKTGTPAQASAASTTG
jgi:multidrug efflux system membrane fusion protein